MALVATIGLDIAKTVFQVHGVDAAGQVTVRRRLTRGRVLGRPHTASSAITSASPLPPSVHHLRRNEERLGEKFAEGNDENNASFNRRMGRV